MFHGVSPYCQHVLHGGGECLAADALLMTFVLRLRRCLILLHLFNVFRAPKQDWGSNAWLSAVLQRKPSGLAL